MKEEILIEWNPWWEKEFKINAVERELFNQIKPWIKRPEIIAITGIRRAGKTTLMYLIIQKLLEKVQPKNIFFIKCDDERLEKQNLIQDAIFTYKKLLNPKGKLYVFLDEVQEIPKWERTLKRIYDLYPNIKMFISGSGMFISRQEAGTLLAGRAVYFNLLPFSFSEFVKIKGIEKSKISLLKRKTEILHYLREYMEFGGFPEVCLAKFKNMKLELLRFYFDTILFRDIILKHNIRNASKFEQLVIFLLTNISSMINFKKIGDLLGLSTDTIVEYSSFLKEAFFIFNVPLFSYSLKSQQINPKKCYCIDTGIRNAIGFRFSKDLGKIAENVVFTHLLKRGNEIYYWKNKGEVDFIVKKRTKTKEAIQVSWNINSSKEREKRSLLEAMDKFKIREGTIITEDYSAVERIGKRKIIYKPIWLWLLE